MMMRWNHSIEFQPYNIDVEIALDHIRNWSSSYNTSGVSQNYNISQYLQYQASTVIWRYLAPIILIVGTVGSVLSLLVLCRKSLRTQTTMFYLSALAVADLLVLYFGLVRLWLEHAENTYIRLTSRTACKLHNFFVYLSLDLSVWILVAVSIDRCLYVTWPLLARKWCTLRNAHFVVTAIFCFSVCVNLHFFWTYDLELHEVQQIYSNGNKKCYAATTSSLTVSFIENVWPWIDFCVYCLFPFLFMATSNAIIIKQLVRTERNMASYQNVILDGGKGNTREECLDKRISHLSRPNSNQRSHCWLDTIKRIRVRQCDGVNNTPQSNSLQLSIIPRCQVSSVDELYIREIDAQQTQSGGMMSDVKKPGAPMESPEGSSFFFGLKQSTAQSAITSRPVNIGKLEESPENLSPSVERMNRLCEITMVEAQLCHSSPRKIMSIDVETHGTQYSPEVNKRLAGCWPDNDTIICPTSDIARCPASDIARYPTSYMARYPASDITRYPASDITMYPTNDITRCPANDITRCPTSDITAYPISDITRCPTNDITAYPISDITRCPANDITRCPTSDITRCPAIDITRCPARDIETCPGSDIAKCGASDITRYPASDIRCQARDITGCPGSDKTSCIAELKNVITSEALFPEVLSLPSEADNLAGDVTSHYSTTSFYDKSCEANLIITSDMQLPPDNHHFPKLADRKNTVYPICQSFFEIPFDILSMGDPGTPNTPEANEVQTRFWTRQNSEKNLLVRETKTDKKFPKQNFYEMSGGNNTNTKTIASIKGSVNVYVKNNKISDREESVMNKNENHCNNIVDNDNTKHSINSGRTCHVPGDGDRTSFSLKNKWQTMSTNSDTFNPNSSRRNTSSVSKTLLAVTIMFWIFNAPVVIFVIGHTYFVTTTNGRSQATILLVWTIVNILQYMNNALHFFLYCLTGPKFRQELMDTFKAGLSVIKKRRISKD